ncbi:hypothetical protein EMIT0P12_70208 [Pseudomonas sp. IT-P12]
MKGMHISSPLPFLDEAFSDISSPLLPVEKYDSSLQNLEGTLSFYARYGVGNPRDRVSGKVHSLVNR